MTEAEIISVAYDLNAMPESCTDKTLIAFARAMYTAGAEAMQEKIISETLQGDNDLRKAIWGIKL